MTLQPAPDTASLVGVAANNEGRRQRTSLPHIAREPDAYAERVMEIFADNYRRLAAGEPLRNPVDLARGY